MAKAPKTRCGGEWTEARYRGFIRSALRRRGRGGGRTRPPRKPRGLSVASICVLATRQTPTPSPRRPGWTASGRTMCSLITSSRWASLIHGRRLSACSARPIIYRCYASNATTRRQKPSGRPIRKNFNKTLDSPTQSADTVGGNTAERNAT